VADIRIGWVRLNVPTPVATVHISWAQLNLPTGASTGLFLFDTPKPVLAGFSTELFDPGSDELDLGAPQRALSRGTAQTLAVVGGALSVSDRPAGSRARGPGQTATLAIVGAPPLAATLPPFAVEIDADPDTTGLFVLDASTLDGAAAVAPDHRWVAVPEADVRTIATRRGRTREDQQNDTGTCTIVLDGYSGDYDPDNPSTPYQIAGDIKLRTGVGVRVKVTLDGVDVYLFTGSLESTSADHGREPSITWTAVDRLADLGQIFFPPIAYSRGDELSSDRVDWLLDYAAVPDDDRLVTAGSRYLSSTEGGGTVLSNLEDVVLAEQGRVFADRENRVVVTQHWEDYAGASTITLSDSGVASTVEYDDLQVEPGAAQVINDATVKRTTKTFSTDEAGRTSEETIESIFRGETASSVEKFGRRSLSGGQGVDASLASDTDMQALADYLAQRRAVPASRVASVTVDLVGLSTSVLTTLCSLDLGDRLTAERTTYDGRALSWDLLTEGIDHTISTTAWTVGLSTAPVFDGLHGTPFRFDTSVLDGSDLIATY
jgi:hypothetical protein